MDRKTVLEKMEKTGVSWCEGGMTKSGNKTTMCGECIHFSPEKCDIVSDELEMCEE